jgi:hypothetical protein
LVEVLTGSHHAGIYQPAVFNGCVRCV